MGRQIAVAMTEKDEISFLSFLQEMTEVQLLLPHAQTEEAFNIETFPPRKTGKKQFFIWNKKFPWQPNYARRNDGGLFLRDIGVAPVIEYDRDPLSVYNLRHGRLYWARSARSDGTFGNNRFYYDVDSFEKWYRRIVCWVQKHSRKKGSNNWPTYYLLHAWKWHGWYSR